MSPNVVRVLFRVAALAEALSWVALLSAMVHKYLIADLAFSADHRGVALAGMLHGAVFLMAFVIMCLVAWRTFGWNLRTLVIALVSAIPPFATIWFERHALRSGLLTPGVSAVGRAA